MLIATCKPGKWQDEGKKQEILLARKICTLNI